VAESAGKQTSIYQTASSETAWYSLLMHHANEHGLLRAHPTKETSRGGVQGLGQIMVLAKQAVHGNVTGPYVKSDGGSTE